jgi:hypothetical protein
MNATRGGSKQAPQQAGRKTAGSLALHERGLAAKHADACTDVQIPAADWTVLPLDALDPVDALVSAEFILSACG